MRMYLNLQWYMLHVFYYQYEKEVLGQLIDPLTILKVLLNDYEENAGIVNEAVVYC